VDRTAEEVQVIQTRQLDAARTLLERTAGAGLSFPYWE
jgi:hypothetical protein